MKKRTKSIFLAVMCMLVITLMPGIKSQAAKGPKIWCDKYAVYYPGHPELNAGAIWFDESMENISVKLISFKSSNPAVVSKMLVRPIWSLSGESYPYIQFKIKGTGKATLTFGVKLDGEVFNYKVKVNVLKYQNPLKSLKIGKRDYASKFQKEPSLITSKSVKGKIKVKPAKGWKLTGMDYMGINAYKKIKNGSNIKMKVDEGLTLYFQHRKTGVIESVWINRIF